MTEFATNEGIRFTTKDSGERAEFNGGGHRDTEAGKPRFDLLCPKEVPYEQQMLTRWAALMGRGAEKYEDRNWELFQDEAALGRAKSSAFRHFMQWFNGETDEDHAAAVYFNVMAAEYVASRLSDDDQHCDSCCCTPAVEAASVRYFLSEHGLYYRQRPGELLESWGRYGWSYTIADTIEERMAMTSRGYVGVREIVADELPPAVAR